MIVVWMEKDTGSVPGEEVVERMKAMGKDAVRRKDRCRTILLSQCLEILGSFTEITTKTVVRWKGDIDAIYGGYCC